VNRELQQASKQQQLTTGNSSTSIGKCLRANHHGTLLTLFPVPGKANDDDDGASERGMREKTFVYADGGTCFTSKAYDEVSLLQQQQQQRLTIGREAGN